MLKVKRSIAAAVLGLLAISSSCERRSISEQRTATPAPSPTPLWLVARITRSRDRFVSENFLLLSHRFASASGESSTYDGGGLRLTVAPKIVAERTITVTATLTEAADTNKPTKTETGPITFIDGQVGTHQVGGIRFTFAVTANPQLLASLDPPGPPVTFVEGTYVSPPNGFSALNYTFDRGGFVAQSSSDADLRGQSEKGRYHPDGKRIILSYDGPDARTYTLNHRIIDGIHLLINDQLVAAFDSQQSLSPPNDSPFGFYILMPPHTDNFMDWWESLPKKHPKFAKLLPGYFR